MSSELSKPLSRATLQGPVKDFEVFCEAELDRRRNSGEAFDETLFEEAVDLVTRRLKALEERGQA